jgi:bacterial/archaeal transporter family-2 protein
LPPNPVSIDRLAAHRPSDLSVAKLGWIILALLAGAVLPMQGAINGLLRSDIGAPFVVGTISFAVASTKSCRLCVAT